MLSQRIVRGDTRRPRGLGCRRLLGGRPLCRSCDGGLFRRTLGDSHLLWSHIKTLPNVFRGQLERLDGNLRQLDIRAANWAHGYTVLPCCPTVLVHRARPRNAIIARSTSMTCSAVSRPTRAWTFDLLTVVSLSIITSLSWSSPDNRPSPPAIRMRISGASSNALVIGATVTDAVASNRSSWTITAGRGFVA